MSNDAADSHEHKALFSMGMKKTEANAQASLKSLHWACGSRWEIMGARFPVRNERTSRNEPTVPRRRAPKTGSEIGSFLLQGGSVNHWAIMLPKNVLYESI